jgi:hypothetical protein
MSTRVLLESNGLGQYYKFFVQAGMPFIDVQGHLTDLDIDDMLGVVERRSGYTFAPKERVAIWKALRLMWARGPGHDCPFIQPAEVPPLFLPKRDWRQMDSDVKYAKLEPDRQRQVIRRKTLTKGGSGFMELQFEVYMRQQDIFYELKDVQSSVGVWMKSDPRKMLREDPREEAMKLRIRTMMDASAGFLQVRKRVIASKKRWACFFFLCRCVLFSMSMLMFLVGYIRYSGSPGGLQNEFWLGSGQFRAGTSFQMAFWVAYMVSDRTKEDNQNRRFQRIIIALERLMEEISSFRVESDHLRMEEHEAIQRNESAALTYDQVRSKKVETASKPKRRRKKKVDRELAAWGGDAALAAKNMDEFKMKTQKAIEESFKRLPPLPDNFRRNGGDRMQQFEDKGLLGGLAEHTRHIKAPWQQYRGEPRPTAIAIIAPEDRPTPPILRRGERLPLGPPATPPDEDALRFGALGDTPASASGGAGMATSGFEDWIPDIPASDLPPRTSLRETMGAMRRATGSLPGSRKPTLGFADLPPEVHELPEMPSGPPPSSGLGDALPEVPPLEPLLEPAADQEEPKAKPEPKAKRSRRRGSKDVADTAVIEEQQAAAALMESRLDIEASGDLREAGAAGDAPPLPPPSMDPD